MRLRMQKSVIAREGMSSRVLAWAILCVDADFHGIDPVFRCQRLEL